MKINILFIIVLFLAISCKKDNEDQPVKDETVTDIDGNVYKTIKIGNQVWMAENLRVTHYRNGDAIPNIVGNSDWGNSADGARCYYDNDSATYAAIYGALYSGNAIYDSRNIAPEGWHVANADDWAQLRNTLGGTDEIGGALKETGLTHWADPNTEATNKSKFTALPGGFRDENGVFKNITTSGYWWQYVTDYYSSTSVRSLYCNEANIFTYSLVNYSGVSVRCVKDAPIAPSNKITDIDGNEYDTIHIGSQIWMKQNLRTSRYNDGTPIPRSNIDWDIKNIGLYCWYNDDSASYENVYGKLYNWYAVNTGKLAPKGWRVATDEDWKTLEKHLGMSESDADLLDWRGDGIGGKLKEKDYLHWQPDNTGATNEVGFTALGGGYKYLDNLSREIEKYGYWWCSDTYNSSDGYYRILSYNTSTICRTVFSKSAGFSIRCIKQ